MLRRIAVLLALLFLASDAASAAYTCTQVGKVKTCLCQGTADCDKMSSDRPCGDTTPMLCGIRPPRHCSCTYDPLAAIKPLDPPVMKSP
jgi:hypothetical protein